MCPRCIDGIAELVARATQLHGNASASRAARQREAVRAFIDKSIPARTLNIRRMPVATPPPIVRAATPAPHRAYVIAQPEHPRDAIRVGDVYLVPVYDGKVSYVAGPLKDAGHATIPYRSFSLGSVRLGSNRAEAFRVTGSGDATVLVVLTAAAYKQVCVSCRTVHFFAASTNK